MHLLRSLKKVHTSELDYSGLSYLSGPNRSIFPFAHMLLKGSQLLLGMGLLSVSHLDAMAARQLMLHRPTS